MNSVEEYTRYSRQLLLPGFGKDGQERLKKASVLVVGAGGLGCPALQFLVAAGVGRIGIIDGDRIELSNLQRQTIYQTVSVGAPKVNEASNFLKALNPLVSIEAYFEKLDELNVQDRIASYDIVVDATDNMETRYIIDKACLALNKPWIFGAVYRYEGQLSVLNYTAGGNIGPSYQSVFPKERHMAIPPDCNLAGVLGVLPGIIGLMQANECIKMITGIGEVLSGKLFQINLLTMETNTFSMNQGANTQ